MKILVIGGNGLIGSSVVKELSARHEVLVAGRHSGDFTCDISSEESLRSMFANTGKLDAIVVTTGNVHWEEFSKMNAAKYQIGLNNKLMGQVNTVLIGTAFLNPGGSFTLTSGIINCDPIKAGSSASMVNGALDSFVKAAAIELTPGIRINVVSPTVILEAMPKYAPFFRGYQPVPAAIAALAYSKSVEGLQTGQVYRVGY